MLEGGRGMYAIDCGGEKSKKGKWEKKPYCQMQV